MTWRRIIDLLIGAAVALAIVLIPSTSANGSAGTVIATWYGPGYYHHGFACGGTYWQHSRGVAVNARFAKCGTRFQIRRGTRQIAVRVIDRCPGCNTSTHPFDLTAQSAMDLCHCTKPYTMRVTYRRV